jgi:predicted nucleic acid-binding protein
VDTAFVQALFNRSDQYHDRGVLWSHHLRQPRLLAEWWVTEAILIEIGNAFSATNRRAALDFIRGAYRSPTVRVIATDTALLERAVQLYEARADKTWGLTDCVSFVVMGEAGLTDALTPDHHFEQAGFVALMKRDPP